MTARSLPRLDKAFARSDRMVGRRIADEFVLVPLARAGADLDAVYNLTRVGAFIWERLDGAMTGAAIVAQVVEAFEVDRTRAERDYREFIAELLGLRAVVAPEGSSGAAPP